MGVAENEDVLDSEQDEDQNANGAESQDDTTHEGEEGSESSEGASDAGDGDEGETEEVIGFGDEVAPASEEEKAAPQWVKELREQQKALKRENAELKARIGAGQPTQARKPELPPKPKLADYDFDEDKFDQARDAWDAKKREVDSWEDTQRKAAEESQKANQVLHESYLSAAKALKVKDFQAAEDEAAGALDPIQQAIVKKGAANAAVLVYALGKNPKKLQELASIKDPVKFAVAVGKLETEVKVTKRTSTKPAPEGSVRSGGSPGAGSKATLDRLEAEAARTGDRSKVIAYKRQQTAKGK